jgi:hypothetical protein
MYRSVMATVLMAGALLFGAPQQDLRVRGVVVEPGTNQPVVDAEVSLFEQQGGAVRLNGGWKREASQTVRTDYRGAFTLSIEKVGQYRMEAAKSGYLTREGGAPNFAEVTLTVEKPAAEVRLFLARPGRLTGAVIDDEKRPIANLELSAVQPMNGFLVSAGAAVKSDANGAFALTNLAPGEYLVKVGPQAPEDRRVIKRFTQADFETVSKDYERTYWPGGHGRESALPVTVSSGGAVNVGALMVRKAPYYRVRVRVPSANCGDEETLQIGEAVIEGEMSTHHTLGQAPCGKNVLITGFAPGDYRLVLSVDGRTRETRGTASVGFSIVDKNLEIDAPLKLGVTVEGSFVAAEGAKAPDFTKVKVALSQMDHVGFADEDGPAQPDEKGMFRFYYVRLVDQGLFVSGVGPGSYVKEIRYNGVALTGDIVALDSGADRHSLTIVTDSNPASIFGAVVSGDQPVSKAAVIARKWPIRKDQLASGLKSARSDEAGTFQIGGLAPGEYRVIAIRSLTPGTPNASLERALAAGAKVEVGENGVQHVRLEVVEVR